MNEAHAKEEEKVDVLCLMRSSRLLLAHALARPMKPQTKRGVANVITALNLSIHFEEGE